MTARTIHIQLITTTNCRKCIEANRVVTSTLDQLRGEYQIEVEELDLLDHPELAARYGIWTTPALVINQKLVGVGRIQASVLRDHLTSAAQEAQETR